MIPKRGLGWQTAVFFGVVGRMFVFYSYLKGVGVDEERLELNSEYDRRYWLDWNRRIQKVVSMFSLDGIETFPMSLQQLLDKARNRADELSKEAGVEVHYLFVLTLLVEEYQQKRKEVESIEFEKQKVEELLEKEMNLQHDLASWQRRLEVARSGLGSEVKIEVNAVQSLRFLDPADLEYFNHQLAVCEEVAKIESVRDNEAQRRREVGGHIETVKRCLQLVNDLPEYLRLDVIRRAVVLSGQHPEVSAASWVLYLHEESPEFRELVSGSLGDLSRVLQRLERQQVELQNKLKVLQNQVCNDTNNFDTYENVLGDDFRGVAHLIGGQDYRNMLNDLNISTLGIVDKLREVVVDRSEVKSYIVNLVRSVQRWQDESMEDSQFVMYVNNKLGVEMKVEPVFVREGMWLAVSDSRAMQEFERGIFAGDKDSWQPQLEVVLKEILPELDTAVIGVLQSILVDDFDEGEIELVLRWLQRHRAMSERYLWTKLAEKLVAGFPDDGVVVDDFPLPLVSGLVINLLPGKDFEGAVVQAQKFTQQLAEVQKEQQSVEDQQRAIFKFVGDMLEQAQEGSEVGNDVSPDEGVLASDYKDGLPEIRGERGLLNNIFSSFVDRVGQEDQDQDKLEVEPDVLRVVSFLERLMSYIESRVSGGVGEAGGLYLRVRGLRNRICDLLGQLDEQGKKMETQGRWKLGWFSFGKIEVDKSKELIDEVMELWRELLKYEKKLERIVELSQFLEGEEGEEGYQVWVRVDMKKMLGIPEFNPPRIRSRIYAEYYIREVNLAELTDGQRSKFVYSLMSQGGGEYAIDAGMKLLGWKLSGNPGEIWRWAFADLEVLLEEVGKAHSIEEVRNIISCFNLSGSSVLTVSLGGEYGSLDNNFIS